MPDNMLVKKIEQMNDFLINMGFEPMKAAEIEPLLMQYTEREAIRGIKKDVKDPAAEIEKIIPKALKDMPELMMGQRGGGGMPGGMQGMPGGMPQMPGGLQ